MKNNEGSLTSLKSNTYENVCIQFETAAFFCPVHSLHSEPFCQTEAPQVEAPTAARPRSPGCSTKNLKRPPEKKRKTHRRALGDSR